MSKYFTKISGYKAVSKCRNCGARVVGKSETYYCDACLERLRAFRASDEEAKKAEAEQAKRPVVKKMTKSVTPAKKVATPEVKRATKNSPKAARKPVKK